MKFRKNLSTFITKRGMNYSAFAADRGISLSQLSQIIHGSYFGTFDFWAAIATDYNLTVSQMIDLYQITDESEEVVAWLKD